ncbi:MAG: hypothetical protein IT352_05950 [Gemmatimonadales bacterium]|nr:hypothetical protein [Gemmatimonadales bacterium]
MRVSLWATLTLFVLGAGCAHVVDAPPPAARLPLVEAVLVVGTAPTPFRIGWVDSSQAIPVLPIDPADVQLDLIGPGARRSLVADPDSAGRFTVDLPIAAGTEYRLAGTINGQPVAGATTTPSGFSVVAPTSSPIVLPATPGVAQFVDYRWETPGATLVLADSAFFPPGYSVTRVDRGRLAILGRAAGMTGPTIQLWALNLDADRYLFGTPAPATNLEGAFGLLGGALARRLEVTWR